MVFFFPSPEFSTPFCRPLICKLFCQGMVSLECLAALRGIFGLKGKGSGMTSDFALSASSIRRSLSPSIPSARALAADKLRHRPLTSTRTSPRVTPESATHASTAHPNAEVLHRVVLYLLRVQARFDNPPTPENTLLGVGVCIEKRGRGFKFLPQSKYTPIPPLKHAFWLEMGGGGEEGFRDLPLDHCAAKTLAVCELKEKLLAQFHTKIQREAEKRK